ncbi:MAG: hypothetical protein KAI47_27330 [Deltaproteobacteria bacterium]|nr:hypothetical protein [Deltaproteobacteria bacterium]
MVDISGRLKEQERERQRLGISFAYLDQQHNAQMLSVNRSCPIVADFTICFERGPHFFQWPELVYNTYHYMGAFRGEALVSYSMGAFIPTVTPTGPERFFYGGDARVLGAYRGLNLSVLGLRRMMRDVIPDDINLGVGLVARGNDSAEQIVQTQQWDHFRSRPLCGYEAINIILLRKMRSSMNINVDVQNARIEDIEEIAALFAFCYQRRLFGPVIPPEKLARDVEEIPGLPIERYYVARKRGRIVGVVAAWDHSVYKRTVVLRLSPRGKLIRLGYQMGRVIFRNAAPLPNAGEAFRSVTLTRVAIEDRDPSILRALLDAVINDHIGRGYHMLHLGLREGDPLLKATQGLFVQRFRSRLTLFLRQGRRLEQHYDKENDPYLDIALI